MTKNYQAWLPEVLSVAEAASDVITSIYLQKDYQVQSKLDNSPVTIADIQAHKLIEMGLSSIDPSVPILSEEGGVVPFEIRSHWSRFWLVDPLDGTREFINGTDEFTVNIALIEGNLPVLGVVIAPILKQSYWALKGQGAYFQSNQDEIRVIRSNQVVHSPLKVAVSRRSHNKHKSLWEDLNKRLGKHELIYCGSALKICLVAKGDVDLYPRLGPTSEWDTAAGQCILEEAGGQIIDPFGNSLRYNTRPSMENPNFYAIANSQLASKCCG